jgi:hypothetical protein
MGLKVRMLLTGLIFAIGFYFGLVHHVMSRTFWPGVHTLAGLLFFTGLGIVLGLNGPDAWRQTSSVFKPFFPNRHRHPFYLARTALAVLAMVVFVAILAGGFSTLWLTRLTLDLPQNFLLGPRLWKCLLFCLPALPAGSMGIVLGLTLDLAFALVVLIETPEPLHANRPRVQNNVRGLLALALMALTTGWPMGFCLAKFCPDRESGLILIPLITCLLVLLATLLENPKKLITKNAPTPKNFLDKSVPELASSTSTIAALIVSVLGGFAVWEIIHWNYALINWCGAANIFSNPITIFEIILLAGASAGAGIFFGHRLIPPRLDLYLTILDRQGLSLALLGIGSVITAAVANQTMKTCLLQTFIPYSIIPLLFLVLAFLWGLSLGLAVPGLAIGRPDRFDLWLEVVGKLGLGVLLAGPAYLIWQYSELGNLLALSAGALLAIAIGGVAMIYDTPVVSIGLRESRTGRVLHTVGIFILYLALVFILSTVPSLKTGWLKSMRQQHTLIAEGPAGAACITSTPAPCLTWAGQLLLPERSDINLRLEVHELVDRIVTERKQTFYLPLRLLLVNLPYRDDKSLSDRKGQTVNQVDIDKALRKSEIQFHHLTCPPDFPNMDFPELDYRRGHYNLVVAFLPTPWPREHAWPGSSMFAEKLIAQASDPEALRFLQIASDRKFNQALKELEFLKQILERQTGIEFYITTRPTQNGCRWLILAPLPKR